MSNTNSNSNLRSASKDSLPSRAFAPGRSFETTPLLNTINLTKSTVSSSSIADDKTKANGTSAEKGSSKAADSKQAQNKDKQLTKALTNANRPKANLPKRTTKTSQKLAFFPEDDVDNLVPKDVSEDEDEVYNQLVQIPEGTFRRQATQFSKKLKTNLPRVTAYSTAGAYKLEQLQKYFQSKRQENKTAPKIFDECLYTPYNFNVKEGTENPMKISYINDFAIGGAGHVLPVDNSIYALDSDPENIIDVVMPGVGELYFFDYGVVVLWGLTQSQEQEILKIITPFEVDKLSEDSVDLEEFHFHYNSAYQPKIYNDVITLKNSANYMVKLTISHAIAQSTKMLLFESLIVETIEATQHIPQIMAETGKVNMSRISITKKIGQLYIMKINVNLVSNILDIPEIFWSEPRLQPLYNAIRGYLEIPQRVDLINQRTDVIGDLLAMLREHLNSTHGEFLEWIVIILIALEIVVGIATIIFEAMNYASGHK